MELKRIDNVSISELYNIVPENKVFWFEMCEKLYSHIEMYTTSETNDDNDILGLALYVFYKSEVTTAACVYVKVKEDRVHEGIGSFIVRESIADLKRRGYRHMLAISDENDAPEMSSVLKRCGFNKSYDAYNIGYAIGDLRRSGIAARMAESGLFANVKKYDELDGPTKRKMEKELLAEGYAYRFNQLNPDYCRWYVVGNVVQAALMMDVFNNELLYSVTYSVKEMHETTNALALMIFSVVNDAVKTLSDDAGLVVEFYDKKKVEAMQNAFGDSYELMTFTYWEME